MKKDPVCYMEVDPKSATEKSEYKGKTYYFCSPRCKQQFDEDAERYVGHKTWGERGHVDQ